MRILNDVLRSYRVSQQALAAFLLIHLSVRLLAAAIIVPAAGLVLAAALSFSGQEVVTDQDIARFLLTPVGLACGLALVSLSILAAMLDLAMMTAALRQGTTRPVRAAMAGFLLLLRKSAPLFSFALRLVLRILMIAAPFLLVGAAVAWLALGRHDINYYLTVQPPEFLIAAALIGLLFLVLALVLVVRLSDWAIALHLVLLTDVATGKSFADSATRLKGQRLAVIGRLALWAILRAGLLALVAGLAGFLATLPPQAFGANLRLVAVMTGLVALLWTVANAAATAWANGALAALLDVVFREATGDGTSAVPPLASSAKGQGGLAVPLILTAAAVLAVGGLAVTGGLLQRVGAERSVEIIAHRGAAGARPENTMAAVEKALEDGADWVEIDVQETADGAVVVAHDSDLMKQAGRDLKIWDATMADLAEIDIGSWFDPAYADERMPTLREVLLAAKGRGRVLIELKYYGHDVALEARVAEIITQTGMAGDVAVMSLKIPGVQKMQALRPDLPHGILAATALGDLASLEADFLAVNTGQASIGLIRRAHEQDQKLYVWTVDDPVTMVRMISMGVDGLITNEPALARQVMEARNRLSAPERLLLWLNDRFRLESFDLVAEEADA